MYEFRSPLRSSSSLPAPSPCTRYSRARVAMCYAPHRPPLGGVNMECTNGQLAGYRRHREQSNPNAASRDQNGANKNPLHHRGFYRPPGCSCKSPHDREPTSGLEPLSCSLRVIHHMLQGCAGACKCRIFRGVSFPCCVLHRIAFPVVSEWYQKQVDDTSPIPLQWRLGNARYGVVLPEPFRHRDDGADALVASSLAATASSSARSFPLLCGPWVLECPLTFLHRTSW